MKYLLIFCLLFAQLGFSGDGMINSQMLKNPIEKTDIIGTAVVGTTQEKKVFEFKFTSDVLKLELSDYERAELDKALLGDGMINLVQRQALLKQVVSSYELGGKNIERVQQVSNKNLIRIVLDSISIEELNTILNKSRNNKQVELIYLN